MTFILLNLLIGKSRVSVQEVDNSAVPESGLFDAMVHDGIILVRVDPQIMTLRPAPVEAGLGDSFGCFCTGKPVYGDVGEREDREELRFGRLRRPSLRPLPPFPASR